MSTNGDRRIYIYQYVFSIRHALLSRYVNLVIVVVIR